MRLEAWMCRVSDKSVSEDVEARRAVMRVREWDCIAVRVIVDQDGHGESEPPWVELPNHATLTSIESGGERIRLGLPLGGLSSRSVPDKPVAMLAPPFGFFDRGIRLMLDDLPPAPLLFDATFLPAARYRLTVEPWSVEIDAWHPPSPAKYANYLGRRQPTATDLTCCHSASSASTMLLWVDRSPSGTFPTRS